MPIRVLLVDDHQAFVEALSECLKDEPGLDVVATTSSAGEALAYAAKHEPDVVLLDLVLRDGDGVEVGRVLRRSHPRVHLVAVTAADQATTAARALRAGFTGWVPKDSGVIDLVAVVRAVHAGETRFPGRLLTVALTEILQDDETSQAHQAALSALTSRELDVLRCMTRGNGRREIAATMFISENTVRTHIQNILSKLGVHSSLSAVLIARRAGLQT